MPGAFVKGEWKTERQWKNTQGRFVRQVTSFRDWVSADGSSGFPAQAGPVSSVHRVGMPVGAPDGDPAPT